MKKIGPKVVAVMLALAMVFSPSVMAMAEARSDRQPIMPTPIEGSAFEEAIEIAEGFLQRNPDGTLTLNMPGRVIETIGGDVYAQLQAGLAVANEKVSGGYLKFDENFEAYVTERYLDKVKANLALHQQSLTQEELQQLGDMSVSRSGNSIRVDFGILGDGDVGILSGGGVTQITFHWWGIWVYLCDDLADEIVFGGIGFSILVGIFVARGLLVPKALVVAGVVLLACHVIDHRNEYNTGVRFRQTWFVLLLKKGAVPAAYIVALATMQAQ